MSGSGPTVFALYDRKDLAARPVRICGGPAWQNRYILPLFPIRPVSVNNCKKMGV